MRALVTGGAGYIGSVVTGHLLQAGHTVTVLDDLSTGHRDAVPADAEFVQDDLLNVGSVLRRGDIDAVLHFAAKSLVSESVRDPGLYWHTNLIGTRRLLDEMRAHGVTRLVFSSTAATYGEPLSTPITEDAPTRPTSAYGSSKLAVDLMLADECRAHGLAACLVRYFNVGGAWAGLGERHVHETHLIPIALDVALGDRSALAVYGDDYPTPDGTCVRDYIHVADLAEAHLLALEAARPGEHRIYNLGTETGYSVKEVVDTVTSVTGERVACDVAPRRPGDPAVLVASSGLIRRELGWDPRRGLVDIVTDAWEFARNRVSSA